jgi:catalase
VAIICAWSFGSSSNEYENALLKEDARLHNCTHTLDQFTDAEEAIADFSFLTSSSVLFDAVYIPHGLV